MSASTSSHIIPCTVPQSLVHVIKTYHLITVDIKCSMTCTASNLLLSRVEFGGVRL